MKFSLFGRFAMAMFAALALGLGMTACGGGTIGYMWVLGQQYNQIAGFKIDDFTGNLTQIPGAPFVTNGSVPVSILVKPGGRYVFVLNQGTGGSAAGNGSGAGIAVFSVGGDGVLTFQQSYQSQGYVPQYMQFDSTGSYLYVLDKYSPGPIVNNLPTANTDGLGSITAFAIDPNTARLSLVTNAQTKVGTVNTTFFEVGAQPFMMKSTGGCLYTVNAADNSISPFAFGSGGQLTFTTTQKIPTSAGHITSITAGGQYLYLTDSTGNGTAGTIFPYTTGTNCVLTPITGGSQPNITGTTNPSYAFVDSSSKYLYVLNSQTTSTQVGTAFSSISAFTINPTNGQLQPIAGAPYTVGAGPVCMVEDPTNQYIYVSNRFDGTVTGKVIDPTTGKLSDLSKGSTFRASGTANCLVVSGAV